MPPVLSQFGNNLAKFGMGVGHDIANSYETTGKALTTLPHALNAAGIALNSMAQGQHGAQLAASKQAALNQMQMTPEGQFFGHTVAQNNAMPAIHSGMGLLGQGAQNILNVLGPEEIAARTGVEQAPRLGSDMGLGIAQNHNLTKSLTGEGGYVRNLATGMFDKTPIHPEDAQIMAAFIDHARGMSNLAPQDALMLERDAANIAEGYNIGGAQSGTGNPMLRLANAFDKVLSGSPEALRQGAGGYARKNNMLNLGGY